MPKAFAMIALLLLAESAFAAGGDDFAERKQEFIKDLDSKIASLQEAKTCISAAQNHDAMKTCHENLRKAHEGLRAQEHERRKQHIDERIKRLQEEKAHLSGDKH